MADRDGDDRPSGLHWRTRLIAATPDVPAIVAAAGVLFDAFAHGVDVSVQALTK